MSNLNLPISSLPCWVCGSQKLELAKSSNIRATLNSEAFAITDSKYGTTGEIHRCKNCGFLQCSNLEDVLPFYEDLQDTSYENSRAERSLQANKLLKIVRKHRPDGRLLDIGAGSGILVQAIKMGYSPEGIEPSKWLQGKAQEYGLPVHLGTFPHPALAGHYDVVTVIDVIEHISNPVNLLSNICNVIAHDGIVAIVTPDVGSVMARILGWKWWHFRVAHIGYFNKKTLGMACAQAGFKLISMYRPSWYFTADYLVERVNTYLPRMMRIPVYSFLKRVTIPLNLGDSMLGIYKLKRIKNEHSELYRHCSA